MLSVAIRHASYSCEFKPGRKIVYQHRVVICDQEGLLVFGEESLGKLAEFQIDPHVLK